MKNLHDENEHLKVSVRALEMTNHQQAQKIEKLAQTFQIGVTEEAILRSNVVKTLISQAKELAEEAAQCPDLKQKLSEL